MGVWRGGCGREETAAVMAEVKVVISEPRSRTRTRRNVIEEGHGPRLAGHAQADGRHGLRVADTPQQQWACEHAAWPVCDSSREQAGPRLCLCIRPQARVLYYEHIKKV